MGGNKKKFYAIARGRVPGIYDKWYGEDGAEAQVKGFPKARFRGFPSHRDAKKWLNEFQQPKLFKKTEDRAPKANKTKAAKPAAKVESPDSKINTQHELQKNRIIIYTDGGCINNPGPGGYGAVVLNGDQRQELSGGYHFTTNNRMELMACIEGLKTLKHGSSATLFSDSRYVVNGIKKGWARRWKKKNWMRNLIDPAENADLWDQLLDLCDKHCVEFSWVKGHAGNRENERCDQLAGQAAADNANLAHDTAFETGQTRTAV